MIYLISNIPFLLSLILFGLIGQTLILDKKRVPSILFVVFILLGIWLGSYGKELEPTAYVIPLALLALGIFLALQIHLTMVGFALMAIVVGFFNGHDIGLNISYTIPIQYFIGYVSIYGIIITIIIEKLAPVITQSYGNKIIGGFSAIIGIVLFTMTQL